MPAPSNRWEMFLQAKGLPFDTAKTIELQKEYQANPSGTHWAPVWNYAQDDGSGAMPQTYVTYQNLETGETTTEKPTTGTILKELGYADIDGGRMVYQDPNTGAFYKDGQKWNATPAEVSRALTNTAESQAEFNKQHSNQEDFLGKYAPAIILSGIPAAGAALAGSGAVAGSAALAAGESAATTAAMPSFGDLLGTAVSNIPKNLAINAAGQLLTNGTIDPKKLLIGAAVGTAGNVAGQYAGGLIASAGAAPIVASAGGGMVSGGLQAALTGNNIFASAVASGVASMGGSLTQDWLNANAQAIADTTGANVDGIKSAIQATVRSAITSVAQDVDPKTAFVNALLHAGVGYASPTLDKAWKSATGSKTVAEASPSQGLIQTAAADTGTQTDVNDPGRFGGLNLQEGETPIAVRPHDPGFTAVDVEVYNSDDPTMPYEYTAIYRDGDLSNPIGFEYATPSEDGLTVTASKTKPTWGNGESGIGSGFDPGAELLYPGEPQDGGGPSNQGVTNWEIIDQTGGDGATVTEPETGGYSGETEQPSGSPVIPLPWEAPSSVSFGDLSGINWADVTMGPEQYPALAIPNFEASPGGIIGQGMVREPETGGYSDVTQEPETGGYSDIITEQETGGYSDVATEPDTGGYSDIETEPETGGYSDTPESQVVAQPLTPPPAVVNPFVVAPVIVPEKPGNKQGPVVRPPPATESSKPNLRLSFADISLSYNPIQRGYIDWAAPRT